MRGNQCPFLHKVVAEGGCGDGIVDEDWAAPGSDAFIAVHGSDGILPLLDVKLHPLDQDVAHEETEQQRRQHCDRQRGQPRHAQHRGASGRCPLRGLFSRASSAACSFPGAADNDGGGSGDEDGNAAAAGPSASSANNAWTFRQLLARSVASISFSGLGPPPGFGPPAGGAPSKGGNNSKHDGKGKSNNNAAKESKSQQQQRQQQQGQQQGQRGGEESTASLQTSVDAVESFKASKCPLARVPGFHKVVASILSIADPVKRTPAFKLACPAPIVAMRAALSATPQVRALRPKPLEEKLAAVAAASLLCNLPLGAWREHTRKFSFEWFVAVHASIPFVVSLRKAVIMPKAAVVVTIASAVLGQYIGSRCERRRVAASSEMSHGGAPRWEEEEEIEEEAARPNHGSLPAATPRAERVVLSSPKGHGALNRDETVVGSGTRRSADAGGEGVDAGELRRKKKKFSGGGGGGGVIGLPGLPALLGLAPPPPPTPLQPHHHTEAAVCSAACGSSEYAAPPRQGLFRPLFSPAVAVK